MNRETYIWKKLFIQELSLSTIAAKSAQIKSKIRTGKKQNQHRTKAISAQVKSNMIMVLSERCWYIKNRGQVFQKVQESMELKRGVEAEK